MNNAPRPRRNLTERQQAVLDVIRIWIRRHGYPPTIRELGQALGIKSLRGVTTHLDAIAKKGFIEREPRARSIRLNELKPFERLLRVPIIGQIRAGAPALAQEEVEGHLVVDGAWIDKGGEVTAQHFALKVRGDSMISAGILNGDFVIVRQQSTALNGDIVVARMGDEATVKRFFRDDKGVRLVAEHPTMPPIIVPPDEPLAIVGKVVAVFRNFA